MHVWGVDDPLLDNLQSFFFVYVFCISCVSFMYSSVLVVVCACVLYLLVVMTWVLAYGMVTGRPWYVPCQPNNYNLSSASFSIGQ